VKVTVKPGPFKPKYETPNRQTINHILQLLSESTLSAIELSQSLKERGIKPFSIPKINENLEFLLNQEDIQFEELNVGHGIPKKTFSLTQKGFNRLKQNNARKEWGDLFDSLSPEQKAIVKMLKDNEKLFSTVIEFMNNFVEYMKKHGDEQAAAKIEDIFSKLTIKD